MRALAGVVALSATLFARDAGAFTISSPIASGCHENITAIALQEARADLDLPAPLPASGDDEALIDDLPFTLPDGIGDLDAVTLLVGVRDNDLHGYGDTDLAYLSAVHGDPTNQKQHCLRTPDEDELTGSQQALDDCKGFIMSELTLALEGLGDDGFPDRSVRADLDVTLGVRGRVTASLPAFYVHLGHAVHTLEDAYAHTFRTADGRTITVVLNWIEEIEGSRVEERDGPAHRADLDRCDDPDELRAVRHALAVDAAYALMTAMLDPTRSKSERLTAAEVEVESALAYQPGCTAANAWCDAPENAYAVNASCGCSDVGAPARTPAAFAALSLLAVLLVRRRRAAAVALAVTASAPASASASASAPAPASAPASAPAPASASAPASAPHDPAEPWRSAFGLNLHVAGAYDHPAMAFGGGVRWRASKPWVLGLDAEWNPFVALSGATIRSGVFNGYLTVIRRWPLAFEPINLRSTLNLGTSVLLMDLYGAERGSVGVFAGATFLGLEWKASRSFYLAVDPLGVFVPAPHLSGIPYAYVQFRSTLGAEIDLF